MYVFDCTCLMSVTIVRKIIFREESILFSEVKNSEPMKIKFLSEDVFTQIGTLVPSFIQLYLNLVKYEAQNECFQSAI